MARKDQQPENWLTRRAREEAHVRDVLAALGGPAEPLDVEEDGDGPSSLAARIEAQTPFATGPRGAEAAIVVPPATPAPAPPAPPTTFVRLPEPEPAPEPAPPATRLATFMPPLPVPEQRPAPPPRARPVAPAARAGRRRVPARARPSARTLRVALAVPAVAAAAAAATLVLQHRGGDGGVQAQRRPAPKAAARAFTPPLALPAPPVSTPAPKVSRPSPKVPTPAPQAATPPRPVAKPAPAAPTPSRAPPATVHMSAAAMTRLVLTSGGTKLVGSPVCTGETTADHWTCRANGRETLGPYAGRLLRYRCSPSYKPQPNGQAPALMVDCTPLVAAPAPG